MESRSLTAYLTKDEFKRFQDLIRRHEGLKYVIGEGRPDTYAAAGAAAAAAATGGSEAVGRGLRNFRSTCWMNALLQLLSHTPTLKAAVDEVVQNAPPEPRNPPGDDPRDNEDVVIVEASDSSLQILSGIKEVLDQLSSPGGGPVRPDLVNGIQAFVKLVDRRDPAQLETSFRDFSESFLSLKSVSTPFESKLAEKGNLVRFYTLSYCEKGELRLTVGREDQSWLKISYEPEDDSPPTVQGLLESFLEVSPVEKFHREVCPDDGKRCDIYSLEASKFLWLWFMPNITHVFDTIREQNPDASEDKVKRLAKENPDYRDLSLRLTEELSKKALIRPQTRIALPATNFKKTFIRDEDWSCNNARNYEQGSLDMMKDICELEGQSLLDRRLEFRLRGFVRWLGNHYYYVKVGEDEERDSQRGVGLTTFNDTSVKSTWVPYDQDGCLDLESEGLGKGVLNFFFEPVGQSPIGAEVGDSVPPEIYPPRVGADVDPEDPLDLAGAASPENSPPRDRSRRSRRDHSASLESGEIPLPPPLPRPLLSPPRGSHRRASPPRERSSSLESGEIPIRRAGRGTSSTRRADPERAVASPANSPSRRRRSRRDRSRSPESGEISSESQSRSSSPPPPSRRSGRRR